MKEYTKRRNVNRGYMKLEVWNKMGNKLLSLAKSLQIKQGDGSWDQKIHEPNLNYNSTP